MDIKNMLLFIITFFLAQNIFSEEFDRKLYGRWVDMDKDCQNTRSEILIRDTLGKVKFKREAGYFEKEIANLGRKTNGPDIESPCNITKGKWQDPYTEKYYYRASDVDIDHIIPLKYAHSRGAEKWTKSQKKNFANDPENLLVTNSSINRQKSSLSFENWLPPNKKYRCNYLIKWEKIIKKYSLNFTKEERESMYKLKNRWCKRKN